METDFQQLRQTLHDSGLKQPTPLQELHREFDRQLLISDLNMVTVIVAAAIANRLPGEPFWLFLVAPPASLKTELISALSGLKFIHCMSDLTAQTFASGMKAKKDPSLLPKLAYGTVITLKDFTTVLSMHRDRRHEILSQLREIYDGSYSKSWGTGKTLNWKGKVGLIAGVTTIIDTHYSIYQTLGERFVQFRIPHSDPTDVAKIAMMNQGQEGVIRGKLSAAVKDFFGKLNLADIPDLNSKVIDKLAELSSFVVLARSGIVRDNYGAREITYVPEPEAPPRLAKQLALFMKALLMCGLGEPAAYRLCCRIGFDSLHRTRRAVLRFLLTQDAPTSTTQVAEGTRYPTRTIRMYLEDLAALGVVDVQKQGPGKADLWGVGDRAVKRLQLSESTEVLLGLHNLSDHRE